MNKKLSERLSVLEEMGLDTSKYNVIIDGTTVKITGVANEVVEDKQVQNPVFRRWITAQTFKMLDGGYDKSLNSLDYKYQFTMMLEELRVLNKLQAKDKESFEERSRFFTKEVVVETCRHYFRQFDKYARTNYNHKKGFVKLANYGECNIVQVREIESNLYDVIDDIKNSENYAELYTNLKRFMKKMNKVPYHTPKCPEWKTAFKGIGAFESLKNMILFHDCLLRGCSDKQESMEQLISCLDEYEGEYWRFHYMLLDIIELNNFDLRESIRRHQ